MSDTAKRVLTVVTVLVLVVGGGLWVFWPAPLPPPDDRKRVTHPSGFSVIIPPKYSCTIGTIGDSTYSDSLTATDPEFRNFPPELQVRRFRGEPDFNRLSQRGFKLRGTFLGRDAVIFDGPTSIGKNQMWNYRVVARFEDAWFEIGVADPNYFEIASSPWKAYIESFKYEARATTAPATVPSTRPAGKS